jgi:hypothetical protein
MGNRLVVIILLLTTALAFAAGDGIKWTRSKEIHLLPSDTAYTDVNLSLEKAEKKYTISWEPATRIHPVEFIDITDVTWEIYCASLQGEVKAGRMAPAEAARKAEETRPKFRSKVVFQVTVSIHDSQALNLLRLEDWEASLDANGEEIKCVISTTGAFLYGSPAGEIVLNAVVISRRAWALVFFVTCDLPTGVDPLTNIKLILRNGDFAHGFEWRFKQK